MDVKLLASQPFLEKVRRESVEGFSKVNPERYRAFQRVFGAENYGFVLAGDVQKEIRIGEMAPVYFFGDNLYPQEAPEKGLGCGLFLGSTFGCNGFPSRSDVEEIMDYLEVLRARGVVGNFINSKRGTLSEDKISVLEAQLLGFRTPSTFHFTNLSEFNEFLREYPTSYVLKHRFGQEGEQFFKIDSGSIPGLDGMEIGDFILQEAVAIASEKRLIFFRGELLGARIIYDRHMPWEEEGKAGRKHITERYDPLVGEIEDTRRLLEHFDVELGCIDWVDVDDRRLYMELNGFGTGLGKGPHPYNLNQEVAERLKEAYF
jgi:hypothetical protein